MNETNRKIQKCLTFIKENVTHVDSIVDKLIEKDVIPLTERDTLLSNKLPKDQIQSVIDVVTRKQKGEVFISSLEETKNDHVAEMIRSTAITDSGDIERSKTFIKESADTEQILCKISKELLNTKAENEHLRSVQEGLRKQLDDKVKRLKDLTAQSIENKKFHEELENKSKKLEELENKCKKLETEKNDLCEQNLEISQLRQTVDSLKQQIEEKDEKINNLTLSLERVENELEKQKETTKEVTDKLSEDNQMLKDENAGILKFQEKILGELAMLNKNQKSTAQALTDLGKVLATKKWMPGTSAKPQNYRGIGSSRTRRK